MLVQRAPLAEQRSKFPSQLFRLFVGKLEHEIQWGTVQGYVLRLEPRSSEVSVEKDLVTMNNENSALDEPRRWSARADSAR